MYGVRQEADGLVPRRNLRGADGLPGWSWLYKNGKKFLATPSAHPKTCSWCGETFWILANQWRACPRCDTTVKSEEQR